MVLLALRACGQRQEHALDWEGPGGMQHPKL